MANQGNGNIPIIGQGKPRAGVQTVGVLIRYLDEHGTYEPEGVVATPNGGTIAVAGRENLVTAEDLVEMMRVMVREEIANSKRES